MEKWEYRVSPALKKQEVEANLGKGNKALAILAPGKNVVDASKQKRPCRQPLMHLMWL